MKGELQLTLRLRPAGSQEARQVVVAEPDGAETALEDLEALLAFLERRLKPLEPPTVGLR